MRRPLDATPLQNEKGAFLTVEAALQAGVASKHAIFEISAPALPTGDNYGVLAGVGRALVELQTFLLDDTTLDYLATFLTQETVEYLAELRFTGAVSGLKEGDLYVARTPVLTLECTYAVGLLVQHAVLAILNFDSAAATAAHLLRNQQRGRLLYSVQTAELHEDAGAAFARACAIAGFEATSDMAALRRYPELSSFGGVAASFWQALGSPEKALVAQAATFGDQLALDLHAEDAAELRDEIAAGLLTFGPELFAVRLRTAEQLRLAKQVRRALDKADASGTNIIFTGYLTGEQLARLGPDSPVDSLGLPPESIYNGRPRTAGFTCALVAIQDEQYGEFRPVPANSNTGGRKVVYREYGEDWKLAREILVRDPKQQIESKWQRPGVIHVQRGKLVALPKLEEIRETAADILTTAPAGSVETTYLPAAEADTQEVSTAPQAED